MEAMQSDFQQLKQAGINSVVALVKWMIDAKIIDDAIETRQKVERMFNDVTDKSNVEWEKFVEVVTAIATERQQNTEEAVAKMVQVLTAGVTAFIETVQRETAATPPTTNK